MILAPLLHQIGIRNADLLLWPGSHHVLLSQQRARLIISRVRLVALLFGMLTPLWILVDLGSFPWPVWGELALARALASAAFIALAWYYRPSEDLTRAWIALAILFAIPTLFFVYSHPMLALRDMAGLEAAIAAGYAFLPFVMIAGLAIFPLTASEAGIYAIPVLAGQAVVALLQLDGMAWTTHVGAFWLLFLIAAVAALASMSQLHFLAALVRESSRDPLTGCYTRGSGERLLARELERARRQGQPLAVAFLDLDRFKELNDRFGHEEGDRALAHVAESLEQQLRSIDSVVRWGGEEFLVLLPGSGSTGAENALKRLATAGLGRRPDHQPLTASVGLAAWPEDLAPDGDWRQLVQIADQRMYLAKAGGGNRIVVRGGMSSTGITTPPPEPTQGD